MQTDSKRTTKVLGALGVAAGLALGAAGIAAAATGSSSTPFAPRASQPPAAHDQNEQQDPARNGSVQAPEKAGADETAEGAALQTRAKITPDEAKQAALAAVPGTVNKVELDNENGTVVYSVEITGAGRTTDVKVDAGNGKVLAQDGGAEGGQRETDAEQPGNEKPATEEPAGAEASG